MFQVHFCLFALAILFAVGYSGENEPVVYSRAYSSPSGNAFGYAYASSSSSAGSGNPSGYRGRTYSSESLSPSHPYSSGYYSSSSSSYGTGGKPYSSYSSSHSQCSYDNNMVTENGYTRPMTDRERQLVSSYEREIMNYNSKSATAIANMNLRFMEQIQQGFFPTIFPFENYQMPQPPCLCSSCRRISSTYRSSYDRRVSDILD